MELTAEEGRVLGCLLEKQRTVPDSYPLTMNALISACNQSTNRDPIVSFGEMTIEGALAGLRDKNLARRGVYHGSRVPKHRHVVGEALEIDDAQSALLCVLLLRGPQTPGELKGRTERLFAFGDLAAVELSLDELVARGFVAKQPRQPGHKESRYAQLFTRAEASPTRSETLTAPDVPVSMPRTDSVSDARLTAVESAVRELRAQLDELRSRLAPLIDP